jgi:type II secretory pathway component PulK
MILLVVLLIVSLLAILGTTFAYRMRADLSAVSAKSNDLQAEWATKAGVERAKLILRQTAMEREGLIARTGQTNDEPWYDNPEAFRQVIVWTPGQLGGKTSLDQHVEEGQPAWRFSIIAPVNDLQAGGEQSRFRYGLTDETSKLNLNTATRDQLIRLFEQLQLENVTPEQLADCLLDWREPGETPRESGAKTSYYQTLDPPYKCKGAPLESVEEVLLIKYFNGQILYGEDYNRNGHLDPNEDDGEDGLFPPDNGDNTLNRGLYAFATVYSRDMNVANDNRARVNLSAANLGQLPEETQQIIEKEIPNIQEILTFVQQAQSKGHKFESVAELAADVKITKATSQPTTQPAGGQGSNPNASNTSGRNGQQRGTQGQDGNGAPGASGQDSDQGPDAGAANDTGGRRGSSRNQRGGKLQRQQQSVRGGSSGNGEQAPTLDDLKAGRPDLDPSAFQDVGPATPQQPSGQNQGQGQGSQ